MEERPESDEHIFPLAIGGTLIIKRVCQACNSRLGTTADAPLSNHLFVVFQRSELKLPGNSGTAPDAMRALFRTGVMANDHDQKIRLEPDADGVLRPRVVYKANDITLPDGRSARSITLDASTTEREVRKIIDRERKRAGLPAISDVEFAPLLHDIEGGIQAHENPEILLRLQIDTIDFKRGLLKIAYELAWLWLGETYLEDPTAAKLRAILNGKLTEEESELRGHVEFGSDIPSLHFWSGDTKSHIAFSMTTGGRVAICIRIFQCISAIVGVSDQPELHGIHPTEFERNRFIAIDPSSGIIRHTSLASEFGRLAGR